jgi:uncharacterized membrane protein YfcA
VSGPALSSLGVAYGAVIGLALGLTGGGGSIFAVPLLVYGLGVAPRAAVGVSLAAVGATSLYGAIGRWRAGEVELTAGLLFSLGGVAGAPLGAWAGSLVPEAALMPAFAVLMLAVAGNMWRGPAAEAGRRESACRLDERGRLALTSPCAVVLAAAGLATGVLAGLFGVGGGFVIVPALVFAAGLPIHRAVATSLLAIALISAAGLASHLAAGQAFPWAVGVPFTAGGLAGMGAGTALGRHLSARLLRRLFAGGVAGVAAVLLVRTAVA